MPVLRASRNRVLRRGMLDNQLNDNAYPQFPRVINQLNNVTDLPKMRIGLQMILHVVTVIEKWRQIKGVNHNTVTPKLRK